MFHSFLVFRIVSSQVFKISVGDMSNIELFLVSHRCMLLKEQYARKLLEELARETYRPLEIVSSRMFLEIIHVCGPIEGHPESTDIGYPFYVPFSSSLLHVCLLTGKFAEALNECLPMGPGSMTMDVGRRTLISNLESFICSNYLGYIRVSLEERSLRELVRLRADMKQFLTFINSILPNSLIEQEALSVDNSISEEVHLSLRPILDALRDTETEIIQSIDISLTKPIHEILHRMAQEWQDSHRSLEEPSISLNCDELTSSIGTLMMSLKGRNLKEDQADSNSSLFLWNRLLSILTDSLTHRLLMDTVSAIAFQSGWLAFVTTLLDIQHIEASLHKVARQLILSHPPPQLSSSEDGIPNYDELWALLEFLHLLISDKPGEYMNILFREQRYSHLKPSILRVWLER
jgi:hypothetical protein